MKVTLYLYKKEDGKYAMGRYFEGIDTATEEEIAHGLGLVILAVSAMCNNKGLNPEMPLTDLFEQTVILGLHHPEKMANELKQFSLPPDPLYPSLTCQMIDEDETHMTVKISYSNTEGLGMHELRLLAMIAAVINTVTTDGRNPIFEILPARMSYQFLTDMIADMSAEDLANALS